MISKAFRVTGATPDSLQLFAILHTPKELNADLSRVGPVGNAGLGVCALTPCVVRWSRGMKDRLGALPRHGVIPFASPLLAAQIVSLLCVDGFYAAVSDV